MVKCAWSVPAFVVGMISCYMQVAYGDSTQIYNQVYNNNGFGVYSFEFETSDGTYRREEGGPGSGNGIIVRGEFAYNDPAGRRYLVRYIADANGYRPQLDDDDTRFNDRRIV